MSRKNKTGDGRVQAHGGTVRKLNIMSEETVRVLKGIIKGLNLKSAYGVIRILKVPLLSTFKEVSS